MGLPGNMLDVRRILRHCGEGSRLSTRLQLGFLLDCCHNRAMVRENCEGSPFQEIPEMEYSRVDSQEFSIRGGIISFSFVELPAEKGEWLPVTSNSLFEYCSNRCVRCVRRQGRDCSRYRVVEKRSH